jgi:hypothetical protein
MQGLHKELIEQFEVLPYKLPLSLYICQIWLGDCEKSKN